MIAVTKLTSMLHKEGLLYWANKIGLEGVSLNDYRKKSTKEGINKHQQVQDFLLHNKAFDESENLISCIEGYEVLDVEKEFNNGFIIGRVDLILWKDNKKIVIDFKSSNDIYLEQKMQISTYKEILNCDYVGIINLNTWELKILDIDTLKYYNIVRRLYSVYELLKQLNEKI